MNAGRTEVEQLRQEVEDLKRKLAARAATPASHDADHAGRSGRGATTGAAQVSLTAAVVAAAECLITGIFLGLAIAKSKK